YPTVPLLPAPPCARGTRSGLSLRLAALHSLPSPHPRTSRHCGRSHVWPRRVRGRQTCLDGRMRGSRPADVWTGPESSKHSGSSACHRATEPTQREAKSAHVPQTTSQPRAKAPQLLLEVLCSVLMAAIRL